MLASNLALFLRDPSQTGRGESRAQAFWPSQNLAAGAIHLPRGCPIPFGAPHLMAIKWGGGPKWTRTTDLTIISRAL